jgi:hypothetical protein
MQAIAPILPAPKETEGRSACMRLHALPLRRHKRSPTIVSRKWPSSCKKTGPEEVNSMWSLGLKMPGSVSSSEFTPAGPY